MKKFIALLSVLLITFSITSCQSIAKNKMESPETAVTNLITAIKTVDTPTISKYLGTDKVFDTTNDSLSNTNNDENTKLIFSKLSCKIIDSSKSEDTATVDAEITALDMKDILGTYVTQALAVSMNNAFSNESDKLSDSEIQQKTDDILINLMKDENAKTTTQTITINLSKNGDSWLITNDETFQDAVTGGFVSAIKSLQSSMSTSTTTGK